jgi:hypothetical protein
VRRHVDYHDYINSAQWHRRRAAWLRKHGGWCRACYRKGGEVELHHLTYARLGRERDDDLMALCRTPCHERVTAACRRSRHALIFRRSMASVTWDVVHQIRKERNPKYRPKPKNKSLWRIAWELIRF